MYNQTIQEIERVNEAMVVAVNSSAVLFALSMNCSFEPTRKCRLPEISALEGKSLGEKATVIKGFSEELKKMLVYNHCACSYLSQFA